jgi:hypothetical protein
MSFVCAPLISQASVSVFRNEKGEMVSKGSGLEGRRVDAISWQTENSLDFYERRAQLASAWPQMRLVIEIGFSLGGGTSHHFASGFFAHFIKGMRHMVCVLIIFKQQTSLNMELSFVAP